MVVPERLPSRTSINPQQKRKTKFFFIRWVISFVTFGICFVAIANKFLSSSVLGLEILNLEWWQIGLGVVISLVLPMGGGDADYDIFKTGRGGPPIIR